MPRSLLPTGAVLKPERRVTLSTICRPSATREPVLLHQDNEFHAAEKAGREARARAAQDPVDACARAFGGCATSVLELFSRVKEVTFPP